MDSLQTASSRTDYSQESKGEIEARQLTLAEIIEEAHDKNQQIDSNYLKYQMRLRGYLTYSRSKLYQDRLALDSQNNYIRDFLPRYSQVQADIWHTLDHMERECKEMFDEPYIVEKHTVRQTKDGDFRSVTTEDQTKKFKLECFKTCTKIVELKQKHCEGQNIQISAVIVQKELQSKKAQLYQKDEIIKRLEQNIQLIASRVIPDESEKKK